jgi:hypothetical protein
MSENEIIDAHNQVVRERREIETALQKILASGESFMWNNTHAFRVLKNADIDNIAAVLEHQDTDTVAALIVILANAV